MPPPPVAFDAQGRPLSIAGEIVGESPIGCGRCISKSYEVQPAQGTKQWVHFQQCEGEEGPLFDHFGVGQRVHFELAYGTDGDPMIVGATVLR